MGGALVAGWEKQGLINTLIINKPSDLSTDLPQIHNLFHVKQTADLDLSCTDMVALAVKPQIMEEICRQLAPVLPAGVPVLSVAAGKTTSFFRQHLGGDKPVIRAMPNLPSSIGLGISALYATPDTDATHKTMAEQLMLACGDFLWLTDEGQMNAVTALSGSGPAYLFHMVEAMAKAGEKAGLSPEHAIALARQTIIGSAALMQAQPYDTATKLREQVTSPNGTTQAGLEVLMDGRFQDIIDAVIRAAQERAQALCD